jgi:hypothetical protein
MGGLLGLWLMISVDENANVLCALLAFYLLAGLLSKENVITILAVAPVTLW